MKNEIFQVCSWVRDRHLVTARIYPCLFLFLCSFFFIFCRLSPPCYPLLLLYSASSFEASFERGARIPLKSFSILLALVTSEPRVSAPRPIRRTGGRVLASRVFAFGGGFIICRLLWIARWEEISFASIDRSPSPRTPRGWEREYEGFKIGTEWWHP